MAEAKKPVIGKAYVVIVSKDLLASALERDWNELMAVAAADTTGQMQLQEVATSDGLVGLLRPNKGFASVRQCEGGMLKGRPILFEQNW